MIDEQLLEKHFHNGRYHVRGVWDEDVEPVDTFDNPLAIMMFSDDDAEALAEIAARSLTTAEAIRRNKVNAGVREAEEKARADKVLAKFHRGERLTNAEADVLVRAGYAYNVYEDPDSNRPTRFVVGYAGDGKAHADWEHEEGLARIGL